MLYFTALTMLPFMLITFIKYFIKIQNTCKKNKNNTFIEKLKARGNN